MLRPIALFSAALTFTALSACAPTPKQNTTRSAARPASTESSPDVAARPAATDEGMEPVGEENTDNAQEPRRYVECEKEIGIECSSGYMDGCTKNLTLYHVCVKEDAKPGPPCEQELGARCFPGETDACLVDPAVAKTHICFKR